ncbi:MAG: type II CRISPR RNA-guided endonuclease Cas9 [Defluviitaleaceae bacterium]|nr:type II CRISPR RNA-guided endonuclease Cas9 [Defluviitaleaceae bacterium]
MRYGIGLDVGIASVGFATVKLNEADDPIRIIKMGSRIFDKAEQPKTGASLAAPRREARGMRRRLRRKAHRKERIRKLFVKSGLVSENQIKSLYDGILPDIYKLRVDALDRIVSNEELARILIHLSQRRGFKSNRKSEKGGQDGELKTATKANKELMDKNDYRTVAEMFHNKSVKRNKEGDYSNTVLRDMVLDEVHKIFAAQRNLGNKFCSEDIEEKYCQILSGQRAFDEGPGKQSDGTDSPYKVDFEKLVGECTLEKGETRAPKASYTFERFNLLQKINHMRVEDEGVKRLLTPAERQEELDNAYKNKKSKYLSAYHKMNKALGNISIDISQRNEIAGIFSLYKNDAKLIEELKKSGFETLVIDALIEGGLEFSTFGNLSIKAMDKIIPFLEEGLTYDKACLAAGYDFKGDEDKERKVTISLEDLAKESEKEITSPVARRALSQCAKVVNAIIRDMNKIPPVYINIELTREMAKSYEDRKKAEKGMLKNRDKNEKAMERIRNEHDVSNPKGQDLVKFKLWQDQDGICAYSGEVMKIEKLFGPSYEIDHIIPYSISYDDTYKNKVLVLARENQQKGDLLPMEYLTGKQKDDFVLRVNSSNHHWKKKNALRKEALTEKDKEGFIQRNLTDTQTITTFMYNYLRNNLEFSPFLSNQKRHVMPVNGAITSQIRKRLGLNKIREDGDLHHAIDALVVACATQGMIQQITKQSQRKELRYKNKSNKPEKEEKFPKPWEYFSEELQARLCTDPLNAIKNLQPLLLTYPPEELDPNSKKAIKEIFVSRAPSRKVTGAAHKETIKGISEDGNQIKRVSLTALKLGKDGEIESYYRPEEDMLLYNALKEQLTKYGKDAFVKEFRRPTDGRLVKKVRILEKSNLDVKVHGGKGSADNDSMVRVDVFYIPEDGYYLVPIYIADTLKAVLPNKAIVANKPFEEWKEMDDNDFIFSLYSNDLIFLKHKKSLDFKVVHKNSSLPEICSVQETYAYYKGTTSSTGSIKIIKHDNSYIIESTGAKTLLELKKCQVDVLGNISQSGKEERKGFFENKREGSHGIS